MPTVGAPECRRRTWCRAGPLGSGALVASPTRGRQISRRAGFRPACEDPGEGSALRHADALARSGPRVAQAHVARGRAGESRHGEHRERRVKELGTTNHSRRFEWKPVRSSDG